VGQRGKLAAAEPPADLDPTLQAAARQAIDESYLAGFRVAVLVAAGLAWGSAACAGLFIEDKR
jgi:hypothetical protein